MDTHSHMIDARLIPTDDHHLIIQKICNSKLSPGAIHSYVKSHRLGLGALSKSNASLLDVAIHQRYRGPAAHIIGTTLSDRLHSTNLISVMRQIRHVAERLTGLRYEEFDTEISKFQAIAVTAGSSVRIGHARKGVVLDHRLPGDYIDGIERHKSGKREDGLPLASSVIDGGLTEYSLFLGVMERANVPWRDMKASELIDKLYFDILADEWCPSGEQVSRVKKLVHALKIMFPSEEFACASRSMAEFRAKSPRSMTRKGVKWSISIDELPVEEAERFAFACPEYATDRGMTEYSPNEVDFDFNGHTIELEKKAARKVSQEGFLAALRAMVSELLISAPEQLDLPIDERNYELIAELFYKRYEDCQPSTLVARLDSLLGLLKRILPDSVDKTKLVQLTKSARRAVKQGPVTVPEVDPIQVRDQALVFVERGFNRAQDLMQCSKPYMRPEHHLILFRNSLMVAFLATEPLRRNSIRQLDIDDLGDVENDDEVFSHAQIDRSRMKADETHDFVIDRVLDGWVRLYVDKVRTLIAPSYDGTAFWVSKSNTRLSNCTISRLIRRTSLLITGIELTPHDFRRLVATYEIPSGKGSEKLTHANPEMTKKYQDSVRLLQVCRDTSLKQKGEEFWS